MKVCMFDNRGIQLNDDTSYRIECYIDSNKPLLVEIKLVEQNDYFESNNVYTGYTLYLNSSKAQTFLVNRTVNRLVKKINNFEKKKNILAEMKLYKTIK